ncbi:hypothetical protein NBH00_21520 [Paraconexibacter antarcticus]|uniref:IrrE N-terminal-like domain-containing protein n=1 Tax=Paraconexibacter antarcticus TaxID=2949664 RepID=A0ABY5DQG0_9ACTN|nr:DUF6782 family putative metallopeptidase [Paraconexibacter antarcticus]UTI63911.1 hypothetical protein NBH00_21520 [Paraconexibacter antarcticus]
MSTKPGELQLDPPIEPLEGDSLAWAFPRLVALAAELGCTLVVEPHPDGCGGCFMPELRIISLSERSSMNHQVKTFVHELSHALLRQAAELDETSLTYSQEELVVESIALSVVAGLGIDTSGYSIPYIASWSENEQDLAIVEACAGLIDRLANRIEDAVRRAPQAETADADAVAA